MASNMLDQNRMLRDREYMRSACLPIPARDTREAMGNILNLDIERRGAARKPRAEAVAQQAQLGKNLRPERGKENRLFWE